MGGSDQDDAKSQHQRVADQGVDVVEPFHPDTISFTATSRNSAGRIATLPPHHHRGNTMTEPSWMARARRYIGLREVPGKNHNKTIVGWWNGLFRDDETPWCGAFVAGVNRESGLPVVKNPAGARNWLNYGVPLPRPAVGAIVVFSRPGSAWSGHVGYVAGRDQKGNLMVLGGNQGDAVSIKPFGYDRVLGYRWPANTKLPANDNLPLLNSDGRVSTNEA